MWLYVLIIWASVSVLVATLAEFMPKRVSSVLNVLLLAPVVAVAIPAVTGQAIARELRGIFGTPRWSKDEA